MNVSESLPDRLQPRPLRLMLPREVAERLLRVQVELADIADQNDQAVQMYFPGQQHEMPRSHELVTDLPEVEHKGMTFGFSWLRYSSGGKLGDGMYHLDANGGTGHWSPDDDPNAVIPEQEVWRVLLNLHARADRRFVYADTPVDQLRLKRDGYMTRVKHVPKEQRKELVIPSRDGPIVYGAAVCVSHVAHTGHETAQGHFLASMSHEVAAV